MNALLAKALSFRRRRRHEALVRVGLLAERERAVALARGDALGVAVANVLELRARAERDELMGLTPGRRDPVDRDGLAIYGRQSALR